MFEFAPTVTLFFTHEYTGPAPPFKGVAVKVTLVDPQIELFTAADELIVTDGVTNALIVRLLLLIVPVFTGALLITLILYREPVGVFEGIVVTIVPAAVEVSVPITTGVVNDPLELLN